MHIYIYIYIYIYIHILYIDIYRQFSVFTTSVGLAALAPITEFNLPFKVLSVDQVEADNLVIKLNDGTAS